MTDFINTAISYYICCGPAIGEEVALIFAEGKAATIEGKAGDLSHLDDIAAYLDEATALYAGLQREEDQALAEAVQQSSSALKAGAEKTFAKVAALASILLPKIEGNLLLPAEDLCRLNEVILTRESRYPHHAAKSDVIPEKLLAAEPGAKLYPSLVKKVEALCCRDLAEVEKRETDAFKAWILEGGRCQTLDVQRAELRITTVQRIKDVQLKHLHSLSQSDHLPVCKIIPLPAGRKPLTVLTWNVMEFPAAGDVDPVLDGVVAYCDQILRGLERKGALERRLLLEAMSSEAVVKQHALHVLDVVQDFVMSRGCDFVLLQEVSNDLKANLMELCGCMGWSACFSTGNDDPHKCDAITCIISKDVFDESGQVEVSENRKVRNFAAARRSDIWIVSCHVPVTNIKTKQQLESGEDVGIRVLQQLSTRFPVSGTDHVLIAAGDWNADVWEMERSAATIHSTHHSRIHLHAPRYSTCLGAPLAIDGIFSFH